MASAGEKARFWPHSRPGSEYLGPDRRFRQQHQQRNRKSNQAASIVRKTSSSGLRKADQFIAVNNCSSRSSACFVAVFLVSVDSVGKFSQICSHLQILGRSDAVRVAIGKVAQGCRLQAFRRGAEQAKGLRLIFLAAIAGWRMTPRLFSAAQYPWSAARWNHTSAAPQSTVPGKLPAAARTGYPCESSGSCPPSFGFPRRPQGRSSHISNRSADETPGKTVA